MALAALDAEDKVFEALKECLREAGFPPELQETLDSVWLRTEGLIQHLGQQYFVVNRDEDRVPYAVYIKIHQAYLSVDQMSGQQIQVPASWGLVPSVGSKNIDVDRQTAHAQLVTGELRRNIVRRNG